MGIGGRSRVAPRGNRATERATRHTSEPSRTRTGIHRFGTNQSRVSVISDQATHRDVWADGDDDAVLDVDVGLLRAVRVHHRPALDQDPRAVPSAAAAGGVTPDRAELPRAQPNPATSGEATSQSRQSMRRQNHRTESKHTHLVRWVRQGAGDG